MEWRESDEVRWLEAELPGARAAFSTRIGGRQQAPFDQLNLGVLTDDEPRRGGREPATAGGGARPRSRADPDRAAGPRRRAGPHSAPQQPSPFAHPGSDLPEVDGHVVAAPGLAPLVFVADCLPVALAGPGGVAMLHCGWRGLAAGIVAPGAEAVGGDRRRDRPRNRPLLLRGRRGGARRLRAARRGHRLRLDGSTSPRSHAGCRRAGGRRGRVGRALHELRAELFFSHRRDGGRTGRQAGLVWIDGGAA